VQVPVDLERQPGAGAHSGHGHSHGQNHGQSHSHSHGTKKD